MAQLILPCPIKKAASSVHDWTKFCLNDFLEDIENINWDAILHLDADDPRLSFDIFTTLLSVF